MATTPVRASAAADGETGQPVRAVGAVAVEGADGAAATSAAAEVSGARVAVAFAGSGEGKCNGLREIQFGIRRIENVSRGLD